MSHGWLRCILKILGVQLYARGDIIVLFGGSFHVLK